MILGNNYSDIKINNDQQLLQVDRDEDISTRNYVSLFFGKNTSNASISVEIVFLFDECFVCYSALVLNDISTDK